ncbi:MAG: hypothetical protein E7430_04500 [Ruminococcaceae bacterium]|nr:hypothetical protein [Oscillospiraceae bacterium]
MRKPVYGKGFDAYTPQEQQRIAVARKMAEEGMVLLENNGVLPMAAGDIALFGVTQLEFLTVGSGSGAVYGNYAVGLPEGLEHVGFVLNRDIRKIYLDHAEEEAKKPPEPMHARMNTIKELPISVDAIAAAAEHCSTAVYAFSRIAGEGRDRTLTEGDWFLSESEMQLMTDLRKAFKKLIVIANIPTVMDVTWIDFFKPDAVLVSWLPGMEGASAVADILSGNVCPSGKLADTFPILWEDLPSSVNFGSWADGVELYTGDENQIPYWGGRGNDEEVPLGKTIRRPLNNRRYTEYQEGLYVGYRYFETYGVPVKYPFGYGLSYTKFNTGCSEAELKDDCVNFSVTVTNTGLVAGKHVVQIYFKGSEPLLERPDCELAAFAKTELLPSKEKQTLEFSIPLKNFASYSEDMAAYILQPGDYTLFVGENSHDRKAFASFRINNLTVLEQLSNHFALTHTRPLVEMSKHDREATYPVAPPIRYDGAEKHGTKKQPKYAFDIPAPGKGQWQLKDVKDGKVSMGEFVKQLTDIEIVCLLIGSKTGVAPHMDAVVTMKDGGGDAPPPMMDFGKPILEPLSDIISGAAGQTATVSRLGIPSIAMSDGPAGVGARYKRNKIGFPTAQLIACSWNLELTELMGQAMGAECEENHIDVWLAPSLNLHRNPLCGRNYEYFSEDPLLTGEMAAAIIIGSQKHHITTCPKHFAANNQETSRWDGNDSIISERVLREMYLRGFEIAVRKGKPHSMMTAYTALNGTYTAARRDLNTDVLRGEWGFDGFVVTDWEGDSIHTVATLESGNDVLMPGFDGQVQFVLDNLAAGKLSRETLESCACHLLGYIMTTAAFDRYVKQ